MNTISEGFGLVAVGKLNLASLLADAIAPLWDKNARLLRKVNDLQAKSVLKGLLKEGFTFAAGIEGSAGEKKVTMHNAQTNETACIRYDVPMDENNPVNSPAFIRRAHTGSHEVPAAVPLADYLKLRSNTP